MRAGTIWWLIAPGSVVTMCFVIAALLIALRGQDPQPWSTLAGWCGIAVSLATARAFAFGQRRRAESAVPGPASARRAAFVSLSSLWLALYVLAISNMKSLLGVAAWPLWAGVAAAVGATLAVGGAVYALLRHLLRETDEYQRLLLMRAALIAAALTFVLLTAWGLLERYVGAAHFSVSLALAPFCVFFAIANWWVRGRT